MTYACQRHARTHTHTRTHMFYYIDVKSVCCQYQLHGGPVFCVIKWLSPYVPTCRVLTWQQASCLWVRGKLEGGNWDDVAWVHLAQDRASCGQAIQWHVTLARGDLAVCRAHSSLALRVFEFRCFANSLGSQGRKSKSLGPFRGKERQSC